ncbi:aspartic proteinase-like protein 1 [Quillaja saponaria]|uniref:Aspartic proteinase-like protein 1 n=1 Tax=Quillaja saponaria TaxID=32244 RepID=A0AAD7PLF7_QUISA|nr:aspartic proteinase-like protein 1 [Quillaja saponaria]
MAIRFLLYLLVTQSLVDGAVALTFSSKLIHRFSDEAKALWVSRESNLSLKSWPKRNSLEYFKLLFSNDFKRQRMKLGSEYDFLFPSDGSETLFFGNQFDWLHYTWIDIGTPNISFLVALDAGSDLLWVPCDCIQCAPLSAGYYNMLDRDLSEYSPSLSSTSKHLSCRHQFCKMSSICKTSKDPCPYKAEYYSENTSTSGFLIEDKLHLASIGKQATQSFMQASVIFGCGRRQSGGYLEGAAPDGVMGLGPGNISVPSLLAKAGLIRNSFSICFSENDSGRILFGDQGVATQQSTPFLAIAGKFIAYFVGVESFCVGGSCLKKTGFEALIDSGSSFTYVPTEIFERIVLEFDKQLNATRVTLQQYPWKYCYNLSSQELVNIPSMRLVFSVNQTFPVYNPMFTQPESQGFTISCLTLLDTDDDYGTIGQNFMTSYHMVFDRENLLFSWSGSNCEDKRANLTPPSDDGSSNPLPTNEQQSIPDPHALAPVVAGRASSKPSLATLRQIPPWQCLLLSLISSFLLII